MGTVTPEVGGYAGTLAQTGAGTIISIGTAPGTVIGEASDLPLNRPKWATANVTNFQSGKDAEYIGTVREGATVNVKGNRVSADAGQVAVETAYQSGLATTFLVTLPKTKLQTSAGDTITFSAIVQSFDFSVSPTKQVEFSIDLQVSGPSNVTPGT
jgi:hypothetical protein